MSAPPDQTYRGYAGRPYYSPDSLESQLGALKIDPNYQDQGDTRRSPWSMSPLTVSPTFSSGSPLYADTKNQELADFSYHHVPSPSLSAYHSPAVVPPLLSSSSPQFSGADSIWTPSPDTSFGSGEHVPHMSLPPLPPLPLLPSQQSTPISSFPSQPAMPPPPLIVDAEDELPDAQPLPPMNPSTSPMESSTASGLAPGYKRTSPSHSPASSPSRDARPNVGSRPQEGGFRRERRSGRRSHRPPIPPSFSSPHNHRDHNMSQVISLPSPSSVPLPNVTASLSELSMSSAPGQPLLASAAMGTGVVVPHPSAQDKSERGSRKGRSLSSIPELVELQLDAETRQGFMFVASLIRNSAAEESGLKCGDIVIKFGNITKPSFTDLSCIAKVVKSSVGKSIPITVLRLSKVQVPERHIYTKLNLNAVPIMWSGGGVLGCVFNNWPPLASQDGVRLLTFEEQQQQLRQDLVQGNVMQRKDSYLRPGSPSSLSSASLTSTSPPSPPSSLSPIYRTPFSDLLDADSADAMPASKNVQR